jgi:hypothetical protein
MEDINYYFKSTFDQLPLSHLTFVRGSQRAGEKPPRPVGKKIDNRYKLLYLDFHNFYKPITSFLR